jgi:hypothetical protein
MQSDDIYWWLLLGIVIFIAVFAISYYTWQEVSGFVRRRRETEEEREERKKQEQGRQQRTERTISGIIGISFRFAGILVALIGLCIFLYQCIFWLKSGYWIKMPFWKILQYFNPNILDALNMSWKGIEKIVVWITNQSAALVSISIGFILAGIGLIISQK